MAYNLPMQINLQKPSGDNIAKVKKSIEDGLKFINLGSITQKSIAEARRTVKAANIGNVSVVLSGPSDRNLASIRKTIESSLSSINIGIDAKNIAELKKISQNISNASKPTKQAKPESPAQAKALNKKTEAEINRANKELEAKIKRADKKLDAQIKIAEKKAGILAHGKADAARESGYAKADVERQEGPKNERMKRKGRALKDYTYARTIPAREAKKAQGSYDAKQTVAEGTAESKKIVAVAKAEAIAADQTVTAKIKMMKANAALSESYLKTARVAQITANQTAESKAREAISIQKNANQIIESNAKVALTNARQVTEHSKQAAVAQKTANQTAESQARNAARVLKIQLDADAKQIVSNARAAAIAAEAQQKIQNSIAKTQAQINKASGSLNKGKKSSDSFWDALEGKGRSFALYSIVSTAIMGVSNAVSQAARDAIKYEAEVINIAQTTGDSVTSTKEYASSLVDVSKQYNISLTKVAQFTRTLAQTGLSFREAAKGAEILARTTLLAGFDSVTATTEGLIAVMETFNITVTRAGQVLESINVISKAYAVESNDLVEAVRRTGGAFASAGGQVEELLALITSVRSTTRESAETISTGFRTIFARLQRPKTIDFLKEYGIQLETLEGQFIGPYQAIREISKALESRGIRAGSIEFAKIAEEIGGIRQLNKVIPLLTDASRQQEILSRANNAGVESIKDLEKAQQGLGYQLGTLNKEFGALVSEVVNSSSFKFLADTFINISKSILGVTAALKPLLPLLSTAGVLFAGRTLGKMTGSSKSLKGLLGFASGGYVPGSGSGDTVPAMLTPGEFVVKKSSAQSFGYGNLANINKYAEGGLIPPLDSKSIRKALAGSTKDITWNKGKSNELTQKLMDPRATELLQPQYKKTIDEAVEELNKLGISELKFLASGKDSLVYNTNKDSVLKLMNGGLKNYDYSIKEQLKPSFEKMLSGGWGMELMRKVNTNVTQDELDSLVNKLKKQGYVWGDAALDNMGKIGNELVVIDGSIKKELQKTTEMKGFAKGGAVGTDTVPAMLTPGEFVINKKSAQAFGYGNLEKVNKYADGGIVGDVQHFAKGGPVNKAKEDYKSLQRGIRIAKLSQAQIDAIDDSRKRSQAQKQQQKTKTAANTGPLTTGIAPEELAMLEDAAKSAGMSLKDFTASLVDETKELIQNMSQFAEDSTDALKKVREIIGRRLDPNITKKTSASRARFVGQRLMGAAGTINTRANIRQAEAAANAQAKADRKRLQAVNIALQNDEKARIASKKANKSPGSNLGGPLKSTDDLVNRLNSLGEVIPDFKGLDPNTMKNFIIKLEAMNRAMQSAEEDLAKKSAETVASKARHPFGISATPEAIAAEAAARAKVDNLRKTKADATAKAITAAGAGGLPAELGLAISEMSDEVLRLASSIETATANVKTAIDEENKAIEAERKAKAKALKDWMDSPLLASAGGTRAERLKEAQEMMRQSDTPEVAAAKKARGEASQKRYKAQMAESALQQQAAPFGGAMAAAKGYTPAKPPEPPVVPPTLIQQTVTAFNTLKDSVSKLNISYIEAAVYAQGFASALKSFGGVNVNQKALTEGTVKGGLLSGAGEGIAASKKFVYGIGKQLSSVGGKVGQFGNALKFATKGFAVIGKGLDILGKVELVGGLFDSLLSIDYGQQKENFIQLGDSAGAASAAAKEYAQSQARAIPIIGGFISAMGAGKNATEDSLDANGKLFVSNARLAASVGELQTSLKDSKTKFQEALSITNPEDRKNARQQAFGGMLSSIEKIQGSIAENERSISEVSGSFFNIGQTLAVAAAGGVAGAGVGGAAGTVIGGIAGGIGGAAAGGVGAIPGAAAGAASGKTIGMAVGAVVGAIGAGTMDLWKQSTISKEQIIAGYGFQTDAIKESSAAYAGAITMFGDTLSNEAIRVVRGGGTLEQALTNVTDQFGEDNINRLFANLNIDGATRQFGKDIEGDIKALQANSETLKNRAFALRGEAAGLVGVKKAQKERDAQIVEGQKEQIDEAKKQFIAAQALSEQERKLRNEREVQSRAIAKEISMRKAFQKGMDNVNQTLRDMGNIEQEISNIGTGKLTSRQAAKQAGISVDPKILEMNTEEILRNKDALSQMADSVDKFSAAQGLGGGAGKAIRDTQSNFEKLAQLTSTPEKLSEAMTGIQKGEETAANELKKNLLGLVGVAEGVNPILEAAVLDYADAILKNGTAGAAEAEQAAREKVGKIATEFIEQNKEKLKELAQSEQKLRELEIEQVNRRMDLAQKVYDAEKSYFEERLALTNKVQEALQIETTGPAKAGFIAGKGRQQRELQMQALGARRGQSFGQIGFGGMTAGQGVNQISTDIKGLRMASLAGEDVKTSFEQLRGQAEALASTIRDEINIEQQYLDSLIDSAKAQQEYTQALNDAQGAIIRDLVTGTDEDVSRQLSVMNAAGMAAQQGSFAGIPEDMKKDIFSLFDQFRDLEIPGIGKRGKDIQREITRNEMMRRFGVDAATADQMASKAVEDRVPIDQRMADQIKKQEEKVLALIDEEKRVKGVLLEMDRLNNEMFGKKVAEFGQHVDKLKTDLGKNLTDQQAKAANDATDAIANAPEKAAADAKAQAEIKQEQKTMDRMNQLRAEADQTPGDYGLTRGQRRVTDEIMAYENEINSLSSKGQLSKEEQARLDELRKKKSEKEQHLYKDNESFLTGGSYIPLISEGGLNAPKQDVEFYKEARRRKEAAITALDQEVQSAISTSITPKPDIMSNPINGRPPSAPLSPSNGNSTAPKSEPVQVQTQGEQSITVRLPDIQALVNKAITSQIFDAVAETFSNIADDVRSAQNFDDIANAMSNGIERTANKSMEGMV